MWVEEAQVRQLACSGGHMGHALLPNSACTSIRWLYSNQSGDSIGADRQGHWGC